MATAKKTTVKKPKATTAKKKTTAKKVAPSKAAVQKQSPVQALFSKLKGAVSIPLWPVTKIKSYLNREACVNRLPILGNIALILFVVSETIWIFTDLLVYVGDILL